MNYDIRLVAYQPNGDRIGLLPEPVEFRVTDTENAVPALTITYPLNGQQAAVLANPVEVAVEYYSNGNWIEGRNARFLNLQEEGDTVSAEVTGRYSLPGYAWQLGKVQVAVSAADRARSGKRSFKTSTPGALVQTLVQEAKARGNISGLTLAFNGGVTSAGSAWLNEAVGIEVEPGFDLLQLLTSLSDQDIVDWYMQGRALYLNNPTSDGTFLRMGRMPTTFDTAIDITAFAGTLSGTLNASRDKIFGASAASMSGRRKATSAVVAAGEAARTLAARTHPVSGWLYGQDLATGTDALRSNRRAALLKHRTPDVIEPQDYYFGSMICDWSYENSHLLAISDNSPEVVTMAAQVFVDQAGTVLMINDSDTTVKAEQDLRSGYMRRCAMLTDRKLACIEIGEYNSSTGPGNDASPEVKRDVVLQVGPGRYTGLVDKLRTELTAQGVGVWVDYGSTLLSDTYYNQTPPSAPTGPGITFSPQKNGVLQVKVYWNGGFYLGASKPGDFKHVQLHHSTSGADFTPSESNRAAGLATGPTSWTFNVSSGETRYFKLVAVDTNLNLSAPSAASRVVRGTAAGVWSKIENIRQPPSGPPTIVRPAMPDDLKWTKMVLADRIGKQRGRYVRLKIGSAAKASPAKMTAIRQALVATLSFIRSSNPKIKFGQPKESIAPDVEDPTTLNQQVGPVALRHGIDLTEAPYTRSLTGLASRIFVYGEAWLQTVIENTDDSIAPWGEWESSLAQGGVSDEKELQAMGYKALEMASGPLETYTCGLTFESAGALARVRWYPARHYDPGDIVLAPGRLGDMQAMKVATYTVTKNRSGITGSITFQNHVLPLDLVRGKQIRAIAGGTVGGISTGGSGTRPKPPAGTDSRRPQATFLN